MLCSNAVSAGCIKPTNIKYCFYKPGHSWLIIPLHLSRLWVSPLLKKSMFFLNGQTSTSWLLFGWFPWLCQGNHYERRRNMIPIPRKCARIRSPTDSFKSPVPVRPNCTDVRTLPTSSCWRLHHRVSLYIHLTFGPKKVSEVRPKVQVFSKMLRTVRKMSVLSQSFTSRLQFCTLRQKPLRYI